ncbi:DUF86 domain-containing protein [Sporolactobacillus shoreae]|uniref:DUF86 domain-containing protein n=1 Tax=Sporolactobacillus shoreae TaxID=1465501 RepID=A0A4Z0GKR2_9BACL|nr:DUF86 domain-containing protein [Sporolactobacillus shoreae]TGA97256.1 DUF86 domain-containing protein [Sporolactobacillus shoreae]
MYFVDRGNIQRILEYFNRLLGIFTDESWEEPVKELALERIAQNLIESIIDVGNQMIDGFIMRDPGGYEDVIDILQDESVLPTEEAASVREVVGLRKMLVQDYTAVDHRQLIRIVEKNAGALKRFPERITGYLEQELGPVSAFTPDHRKE